MVAMVGHGEIHVKYDLDFNLRGPQSRNLI